MADQYKPTVHKYSKGSHILIEGRKSGKFFIIKEGEVLVTSEVDSLTQRKKRRGKGDKLGVIPVMASYRNIEAAEALTDVTVLEVEKKYYEDFIRSNPVIAMEIIQDFAREQRFLNEKISIRMLDSSASNSPSHLFHVAEYYQKNNKYNQAAYAYRQFIEHCPDSANRERAEKSLKSIAMSVTVTRPSYPAKTEEREYPKGCLLFAEGEKSQELYFIQEGAIKISKIVNNNEVLLSILKRDEIVGEMAILDDKPRSATAEVYKNCRVLAVNQETIKNFIKESPELVNKLTKKMAEHIWVTYKQLATTLIEDPVTRIYESLLTHLEKERVNLSSSDPSVLNFGFYELTDWAGIPEKKRNDLLHQIVKKSIEVYNEKIVVGNPSEIVRQVNSYRKAHRA